jgi:threonine dehydrogenase-like Zn-dependent dehydrogenase
VRVLRVGVCGTDLHAYRGRQPMMVYPVVLGHELAVEVLELGPPTGPPTGTGGSAPVGAAPGGDAPELRVGEVCTVLPYLEDGTCGACRRGLTNCCETLAVLGVHRDGGMVDELTLPARLLIGAGDLPLEAVALVEMLAIGAHAVRRAAIGPDDTVLVLGAGPIGLSALAFARLRAGRVLALELDEERVDFVNDLGLAHALEASVDADTAVAAGAVREHFGGELPTVVMDATGNARSMEGAGTLAAHGGRLVFIGHTKGTLTLSNPLLHSRELSVLCSRNATRADFGEVLRALRAGEVDPTPWITTRAAPAELVRDLPGWTHPGSGVVKALLEMQPPAPHTTGAGSNGDRA